MKKASIWGYPRLCLWLILPVMLCSCVVKNKKDSTQKYVTADIACPVWKIEVFIMPVPWMGRVPGEDLNFVLQPYTIKKVGLAGNSQVLQLSFRTNNSDQASRLLEQLLETGMVEQVYVTKE